MQPGVYSSPLCSAALLRPLGFPILTLDERKLTPALGYVFNTKWIDPCESLISILWKFERANAVPGHVVARLMGPDIDPYEGVAPQLDTVDIRRLHATLAVPVKTLRASLLPASHSRYSGLFRYCRRCVARGYHSVLHQMDGVSVCPAHRKPLETACYRCGYEAPYRASVQLLEAPYRCAYCRASYGGRGWSPDRSHPMKAEYRKAIMRLYFRRCLG
jgi:TniQ